MNEVGTTVHPNFSGSLHVSGLQEKGLAGLLIHSGCTHSTACGADGVCAAYGRVMAWALVGLGFVRIICCAGEGRTAWLVGVLGHLCETAFWWSEYALATLPRLRALPSSWKRAFKSLPG